MVKALARNRLLLYRPYSKQLEFHEASATHRERLLMAGNRQGKSHAGAAETAMHLTGRYPAWWKGRVFAKAVRWWAAGITNEKVRDVVQRKLFGSVGHFGTGFIPKADIQKYVMSRGSPGLIDYAEIKHQSGGTSWLSFMSYDQGWEKFASDDIDGAWLDEEPKEQIYSEVLTRTVDRKGLVFITFTPLQGMTKVVRLFYPTPKSPGRHLTHMQIEDAEHIAPEDREEIIAAWPDYERKARARGIPMLGSGPVFPIDEERIKVEAFTVPSHWPQIVGLDFGAWDHPTAATRLAWDRDDDCLYAIDAYKANESPIVHAATLRRWGTGVPVAWPHDGYIRDRHSGDAIAEEYRGEGVNMLWEHATFEEGGNGINAGVEILLDRMRTGRFKVFGHLEDWLSEFRTYHRKNGVIVAEGDDLMAATRYALMMLRFASAPHRKRYPARVGVDYDPFDPGRERRVATYGGTA